MLPPREATATKVAYGEYEGEFDGGLVKAKVRVSVTKDLCNLKIVKNINLAEYDRVIIGSSVYFGKIRTEVSALLINQLVLAMNPGKQS